MATRKNGGTFDAEVREEFIKHHLQKFINARYHEAFVRDFPHFRYEVTSDYDFTKMATIVRVRSQDLVVSLMVAEDGFLQVNDRDDWMMYHLQRLEPLMDLLIFHEWFQNACDEEDRKIYRRHLATLVKSVSYIPPRVHNGPMYQSRYTGSGVAVCPDWLCVVEFKNGAKRREVIQNIQKETSTWIAMLLMVADNKELNSGVHAGR